jgi:hypothetical protein
MLHDPDEAEGRSQSDRDATPGKEIEDEERLRGHRDERPVVKNPADRCGCRDADTIPRLLAHERYTLVADVILGNAKPGRRSTVQERRGVP